MVTAGTVGVVTLGPGPDSKRMRLRYAGTCRLCGAPLDAGADAVYERAARAVRCVECPAGAAAVAPTPDVAGASARREFERRKQNREQRIRTNHPKLGGLILALSDEPQSTQAWAQGAVGEELMARRLEDLPETFRVLHDRRIPGTRANIDHIVIGPPGVWVIDSKRYKNKRPTLQVDGGIIRPRTERLRIGGRDRSNLVEGIRSQVERVTTSLDAGDVSICGVLCFLEADWPLIGGSFTVNGIQVLWPELLLKRITRADPPAIDVDNVHAQLATAFPQA